MDKQSQCWQVLVMTFIDCDAGADQKLARCLDTIPGMNRPCYVMVICWTSLGSAKHLAGFCLT